MSEDKMATSDPLAALAKEIGYSDGADDDESGGVDALIDYKNALEDRCRTLEGAELSEEARALIAACVATSDEIDMETLTAPPETWTEVRTAFPLSLYHDSRIIEGGIA